MHIIPRELQNTRQVQVNGPHGSVLCQAERTNSLRYTRTASKVPFRLMLEQCCMLPCKESSTLPLEIQPNLCAFKKLITSFFQVTQIPFPGLSVK